VYAGGKIVFYTEFCPYKKWSRAAVVMDMNSACHRQTRERKDEPGTDPAARRVALSVALQEKPEETQQLYLTAYGIASNVAVILPYSRKQEYEAIV